MTHKNTVSAFIRSAYSFVLYKHETGCDVEWFGGFILKEDNNTIE